MEGKKKSSLAVKQHKIKFCQILDLKLGTVLIAQFKM